MCGIAGFTWPDAALVRTMADSLRHRGPNDEGFHVDEFVSLGHRRLSIVDLTAAGRQPMTYQHGDRRVLITFNGEVFNFKEIRQALITRAYQFLTDKAVKADMILRMEHGKPLLYGKDNKKGIRFNAQTAQLEAVVIGEHGVTEKDILVHDAKRDDPTMAFMLANLAEKPGFPTPIGIFREVRKPTADELTWEMIEKAKSKKGDVDLKKFLSSGDTWTIK
jgi:hypothetical protein